MRVQAEFSSCTRTRRAGVVLDHVKAKLCGRAGLDALTRSQTRRLGCWVATKAKTPAALPARMRILDVLPSVLVIARRNRRVPEVRIELLNPRNKDGTIGTSTASSCQVAMCRQRTQRINAVGRAGFDIAVGIGPPHEFRWHNKLLRRGEQHHRCSWAGSLVHAGIFPTAKHQKWLSDPSPFLSSIR